MLVGRSAETDDPENERHAFFVDLKPHGMGISRDTRLNLVRRAGLIWRINPLVGRLIGEEDED